MKNIYFGRIIDIRVIFLSIFLSSVVCSDLEKSSKTPKGLDFSGFNFVLWWLLSPYTPDPRCFPSDTYISGILLEKNKKYISNKEEKFQIILEKNASILPIHLRITLLEDNCKIVRGTSYCQYSQVVSGMAENSKGVSCSDGTISYLVPLTGINTTEDCTLSYDVSKVEVGVYPFPFSNSNRCMYEVYYY